MAIRASRAERADRASRPPWADFDPVALSPYHLPPARENDRKRGGPMPSTLTRRSLGRLLGVTAGEDARRGGANLRGRPELLQGDARRVDQGAADDGPQARPPEDGGGVRLPHGNGLRLQPQ